jgi:hypothetical protein
MVIFDHPEVWEEETKVTVVTIPSFICMSSSEDLASIGDRISGNRLLSRGPVMAQLCH